MKVLGITGGIATGVTLVARMFGDLGAVVVEADEVSREVVRPGSEVYRAIVEAFGPEVVGPDGALDRRRLGRIVFGDPAARTRLNAITHPAIRRRLRERIAEIRGARPDAVVVVDLPLLLDTVGPEAFDLDGVIVVTATPEQQIHRVMRRDGLTQAEAQRRLEAQRPVALKAAEADWVIDNSGTVAETRAQVEALWRRLTAANT
ncbi:MAG: dephospho-CoA kinase [Armatimonadota bacterium]|nr:dephospho-CoA kinase [Armatimonadota bacterium]MDR7452085.1 dephospho-CoA kinase [Armatimonadota bacterium]MDR7466547.1 dephospho-CoA kinase [Armatimonadota bacterium]MDR7493269.1 dephospho-CoA kinase [Armatimonadota bacterium]MDR7499838.1 dephospho-CoA kinase [Armatimonadota bacterium]